MDNSKSKLDDLQKSSKRLKTGNKFSIKINDVYHKHADLFSESFLKRIPADLGNGAEVICDPFLCCVLTNFIESEDFLIKMEKEVLELEMQQTVNDLYQFTQSKDLGFCPKPCISEFKNLLKEQVLDWMRKITKIPLSEKVDISCSCYSQTDHLLCHDDELKGRRIAFIYYLVPEWSEKDGGSLDLFNTVKNVPSEICRSILPKRNNFVFFEVSPVSYHQVSEVLSTKKRISLSGWFHGPPLKSRIPQKEVILFKEPFSQEINVAEWINPIYLDPQTQLDIRESFEDNSELSLSNFLQDRKYEQVSKALTEYKIKWCRNGPPNRKNVYEAILDDDVPNILKECQTLFTSEAFLLILSNFTSLKLHPACDEDAHLAKVYSCIRKWCHGSYTLLHNESFSQVCTLNAFMYFNCDAWDSDIGGYCSFVEEEENEELLRVEPVSNTLALVYITEGTSNFVKYINSKANGRTLPFFNDIFCMYLEDDVNNIDE